jgi:hypothetical protein
MKRVERRGTMDSSSLLASIPQHIATIQQQQTPPPPLSFSLSRSAVSHSRTTQMQNSPQGPDRPIPRNDTALAIHPVSEPAAGEKRQVQGDSTHVSGDAPYSPPDDPKQLQPHHQRGPRPSPPIRVSHSRRSPFSPMAQAEGDDSAKSVDGGGLGSGGPSESGNDRTRDGGRGSSDHDRSDGGGSRAGGDGGPEDGGGDAEEDADVDAELLEAADAAEANSAGSATGWLKEEDV